MSKTLGKTGGIAHMDNEQVSMHGLYALYEHAQKQLELMTVERNKLRERVMYLEKAMMEIIDLNGDYGSIMFTGDVARAALAGTWREESNE